MKLFKVGGVVTRSEVEPRVDERCVELEVVGEFEGQEVVVTGGTDGKLGGVNGEELFGAVCGVDDEVRMDSLDSFVFGLHLLRLTGILVLVCIHELFENWILFVNRRWQGQRGWEGEARRGAGEDR